MNRVATTLSLVGYGLLALGYAILMIVHLIEIS